jgi:ubiquinone biosynthesis protein
MNDRHRREREIAEVLARHGLVHLVAVSGLDRLISRDEPYAPPRNLREALEELGPTFVKIGQLASTRGDLLGPGYRAELDRLQDAVAPFPAAVVREALEQELEGGTAAFASFDETPVAAASIGQAHAATLHDGTDVVVKVQYPGVADSLRADLDDADFLRKLAGAEVGSTLDDAALAALAAAVRGELDYRGEAAMQAKFAAAWADHKSVRVPRVIAELSSQRVLTMVRARGASIVDASHASADTRRQAAAAIFAFAFGSPLAHGLVNADPNPGNFLVQTEPDGHVLVWCLDFGCALDIPEAVRDADRELWWAIVDDDAVKAGERFRMALGRSGLLRRTDSLATTAHRDWERALAQPLATQGDFHWTAAYASELADTTRRALGAGGLQLPARLLLLWRQRLGVAAVLGMLDASAPFRRILVDLIGTGRKALR